MQNPLARANDLLIKKIGLEATVYDKLNGTVHNLNPVAARVWSLSDGQHTIDQIAQLITSELNVPQQAEIDVRGLVLLALRELNAKNLMQDNSQPKAANSSPPNVPLTRRDVIKAGTLLSGFAAGSLFPLIQTIVSPATAAATTSCQKDGMGGCMGECDAPYVCTKDKQTSECECF
jgi:hypothetical protein